MSEPAARTAVVAGAGVGGLAAAIALVQIGWDVTVLERSAELRADGAGWSFAPNAWRAVQTLGLRKEFDAISAPSHAAAELYRPNGNIITRHDPGRDQVLLANHRRDLIHLLYDQLSAGTVRFGTRVTGVAQNPDGVTVAVIDSTGRDEVTADLLVGADGLHSVVRSHVNPGDTDRVFQHAVAWRGVTAADSIRPFDGFQTWGRGTRFGAHPIGGRRVFWFVVTRQDAPTGNEPESLPSPGDLVGDWHCPISRILDATPSDAVLLTDVYDLDPQPTYVHGRTVLLGDAAHAMTPMLAQGACQALEDAVQLAACLNRAAVGEALRDYDRLRRPRTQRIARLARIDPRVSLSRATLTYRAATTITRLAPRRFFQHKTDWIWHWNPE